MEYRTPLLLLPGLLNDADLWADQTNKLTDIAACHVGDTSAHDNIPDVARAILSNAPETFAMAGLSMGGYVAFEILRQAPERVTRLALIDTTARPDTEESKKRRHGLIDLAQKGKFKGVTPKLIPSLIAERNQTNERLRQRLFGMAERVGLEGFIRQQTAIMARPDSRPLLPEIHVPTLVICGREDAITPPFKAEEMAANIPDADLMILGGVGHLAPMERPAAVTQAMRDWLASSI